jgi:hypothetical protein
MAKVMPTFDYWVSGSGPFPVDMLRVDEAWPATSFDSTLVISGEARVVRLRSRITPTIGDWRSFGWLVHGLPARGSAISA